MRGDVSVKSVLRGKGLSVHFGLVSFVKLKAHIPSGVAFMYQAVKVVRKAVSESDSYLDFSINNSW